MNDYHDYVIKDGQFIGKFEEMYQDCDDPWNASKEDYDTSICSMTVKHVLKSIPAADIVSLGCGTGRHLHWVKYGADGVEISATAVALARRRYPRSLIYNEGILSFLSHGAGRYQAYLFREVLWYLLPDWKEICDILARKHGAWVMVELSFYDDQRYGKDYFDGPDDFIAKWPFTIEKIVREHTTKHQREGRIMVVGRVL